MANVITLLFCRRPEYVVRMLNRLKQCRGVGDHELIIQLDGPPMPAIQKMVHGIDFAPKHVEQSKGNLGCNRSTRKVLSRGFERSDYVIHVEEDIALAPDALEYFQWARQFGAHKDLLTVAAINHPEGCGPSRTDCPQGWNHLAGKRGGFTCWGWATWKDRWKQLDANWTTGTDENLSWDIKVEEYRRKHKLSQLMPYVSRAVNIGKENGVHRGDYMYKFWAGDHHFSRVAPFRLV